MHVYLVVVDMVDKGEYGTDTQLLGAFETAKRAHDFVSKTETSMDCKSARVVDVVIGKIYPLVNYKRLVCAETEEEGEFLDNLYENEVIHLGRYFE